MFSTIQEFTSKYPAESLQSDLLQLQTLGSEMVPKLMQSAPAVSQRAVSHILSNCLLPTVEDYGFGAIQYRLPFIMMLGMVMESSPLEDESGGPELEELAGHFADFLIGSVKEFHKWQGDESFPDLSAACQAFLGPSKRARKVLREKNEGELLETVRWQQKMMHQMINVKDDEEVVVMSLLDNKGAVVKISGISDNYALQILLAGALIQPDGFSLPEGGKKPSEKIIRVAKGLSNDCSSTWVGIWNLENWTTDLNSNECNLPDYKQWVWGEGEPGDIAFFRGRRVLILKGSKAMNRGIPTTRTFSNLLSEVEVIKYLSQAEFDELLNQMKNPTEKEKKEALKFVAFKCNLSADE
eukprot:TRINITY_DN701_c0_g2_i1.p1 TRINITY_DN701_c0_g2~~TRINITY_DN701_c0_g2_i1.p1  ORF type:complete len:354 (+),score=110.17 TRINITY_DN701_c0_g2_i1:370-1431(+)